MEEPDSEDHEGRSTPNNITITQTIVDLETCMMGSKIAQLLKSLLKNQQSKCGPTKSVVYTQWTQFLDLICVALSHHSIPQGKALKNFLNNPEGEVLIASIDAAGTFLNITCSNIVYLLVWGPPKILPCCLYSDIHLTRSPIATQPLSLRLLIDSIILASNNL
ncbi:hypothetical protein O181_036831 [Austropuccinia psidii MF-1]|uniref:Uncharacterized protein n=1 Tax=Austropuccinia psidii MF-1 TaxID=1389203 RepID=A0A9Q3D547_9BASI|nr:hypothetical protein [Austropuccinia psidii MF-1]